MARSCDNKTAEGRDTRSRKDSRTHPNDLFFILNLDVLAVVIVFHALGLLYPVLRSNNRLRWEGLRDTRTHSFFRAPNPCSLTDAASFSISASSFAKRASSSSESSPPLPLDLLCRNMIEATFL